jgi:molybdopterin-guanine dinucleotide biosynthesis protein A
MADSAIVLCGGRSTRMGCDKASLPFGGETLLARVVRTVSRVVDEVVLVAREGQVLPRGFDAARDTAEGLGPLAGVAVGLRAVSFDYAFVTACDAPFLQPALIRRLLDLARGYDAAVPRVDGYTMTTAAVYARSVAPIAEALVAERRLELRSLLDRVRTRVVSADELVDVDPSLASFVNCNTPESYESALREGGVNIPLSMILP